MSQWKQLQPNEIGDMYLRDWAPWYRDSHHGGVGAEGYLREKLDKSHDGVPPDQVQKTEKVLAKLSNEDWFADHWRLVKHYYLGGNSVDVVCISMSRTEGYVRMMLRELTEIVRSAVDRLTNAA